MQGRIDSLQLLSFMFLGEEKYRSLDMPYRMHDLLQFEREAFQEKVEKIARDNGIGELAAMFYGDIDLKEIERDSESYFRFLGFDREEELYGECEKETASFLNHHFFKNVVPKHVTAKPLEAVGGAVVREAIARFGKAPGAISLYNIVSCPGHYDNKVSSILFEHDEPTGLFLVQKAGDTFYPVFLYMKNAAEALALFLCSLQCAAACGHKENVRVISTDSGSASLSRRAWRKPSRSSSSAREAFSRARRRGSESCSPHRGS